jgi:hypothetical protein
MELPQPTLHELNKDSWQRGEVETIRGFKNKNLKK